MLLPSFMECLRGLTIQGRSFSVCFRTFGQFTPPPQKKTIIRFGISNMIFSN